MTLFVRISDMLQRLRAHRGRLGALLSNYVIYTVAKPTLYVLIGFTTLILTKDLLSFSDFVINRGFGVSVVALIAFYEIIPLVTRSLPFALLVGSLVGLGNMQAHLEIVAIQASGIAKQRLVGPILAFAAILMAGGLVLTLFCSPWAIRSLDNTLRDMATHNPGLGLRQGVVREIGTVKLLAHEVSARGDQLRGVLLWSPEQGQMLFAERGDITADNEGHRELVLYDGLMLPGPQHSGETTHFTSFVHPLQENTGPIRRNENFLTGLPLDELASVAWSESEDEEQRRRAQLEWHHRVAYPIACLCFGLLAVPLAVTGRKFSRATGGVTGLVITLLYYSVVQFGNGLVQSGVAPPWLGVWLPNLLTSLMALTLLWQDMVRPLWQRQRATPEAALRDACDPTTLGHLRRYILPRYIARTYGQMLLLSFAVLLTGYFLVDLLERLQWFARFHADLPKAVQFYRLWLQVLAARVIPMSTLLAAAISISVFSRHHELIGMRACGISAARALAPMLLIAGGIVPLYFVLNEVILPHTNAQVDEFKNVDIKQHVQRGGVWQDMLWWQTGKRVYYAPQIDLQRGTAQSLTIYELGANGLPVSRIDARTATHVGDGLWTLVDPVRTDISAQGVHVSSGPTELQLGDAPREATASAHLSVWELQREIAAAQARGYNVTSARVDFHTKIAAPLACLLLPTVALVFASSGPPFPTASLTLLISGIVGVGYLLLTSVCAALGYGGFLPPGVAGWVPSTLLVVLASIMQRWHAR